MSLDRLTLSRRELFTTAGGAGLVGGVIGTTATNIARGVRPSFSIVGDNEWQLILLDVDTLRTLLVVGSPPLEAYVTVPTLMGVFRQRIDLLVASTDQIESVMAELGDRWSIRRTVSIAETMTLSGAPQRTTDQLMFGLPHSVELSIIPMPRGLWRTNGPASAIDWIVRVSRGAQTILICSTFDVMLASSIQTASVMISPTGIIQEALHRVSTRCIATNASEVPRGLATGAVGGPADTQLVRIYNKDIARFELTAHGVAIPSWHQPIVW